VIHQVTEFIIDSSSPSWNLVIDNVDSLEFLLELSIIFLEIGKGVIHLNNLLIHKLIWGSILCLGSTSGINLQLM